MTAIAVEDQPPPIPTSRRATWDVVIDHVEGRRTSMPRSIVDLVVADMRARDLVGRQRYGVPLTSGNGRDHLIDAYQEALDFAVYLANELDEHGASPDGPIDVRDPRSAHLVRVQSMLWDHVRTIVQLRSIIEERVS